MKKNKKPLLSRLFDSNISLLILAFVLSFACWTVVSFVTKSDKPTKIDNIPVSITFEDQNSKEFTYFLNKETQKNATTDQVDSNDSNMIAPLKALASAEVKGSAIAVSSLEPTDIKISGKINGILTPKEYKNVQLYSERTGAFINYSVESISPESLDVFVDKKTEQDIKIINNTTVDIDDENKYSMTTLSKDTVKIIGPETIVGQIDSVEVEGKVPENKTVEKELKINLKEEAESEYSQYLSYVYPEFEKVEVTSSILDKEVITLHASLTNKPDNISVIPTISPSSVTVVGPGDKLEALKSKGLEVGPIDYSELSDITNAIEKTITIQDEYKDCKVISEKKGEDPPSKASVRVDLHNYDHTELTATIKYSNDDYYFVYLPNTVSVKVCGDEDLLKNITAEDITIEPVFTNQLNDLTSGKTSSLHSIPLKITLDDKYKDNCWISGKYSTDITVTKK